MIPRWLLGALQGPLYLVDRLVWATREHRWRSKFGRVGRGFVFDPVTSNFVTPDLLEAGEDCFINMGAHVSGIVVLGDRVLVGPGVKLMSGNHLYGLQGMHARYLRASPENPELLGRLVIESDAWIGAGAIVIGAVTVGAGSVLAAGSVANRDVPPYVLAAGSPARAIRRIFDDAGLAAHLAVLGMNVQDATALIARRNAGCGADLPLATPALPPRYLYRDAWVTVDRPAAPRL